ncbi:RNA polymerase subunit sigma-24 [Lysinibacillus sp. KCTC 33748]|uniref:RNA polymerase sigma factor n=1 Tax=unclassified Lysinibacillus TaxID=2636778 RepID=UPI0009A809C0|nr:MULTISPECIES: RNA polymerase sigma factor [unclassified Lysinibacillus]OXS77068.1 RNA polymerase subunit sigma-24 [Lysinibacillus sp. KCTC 33748]SKB29495.1 RNA polymerase sigma-70 factor, ECF subfamily [Lysinibacillus sp. AC-3]
MTVLNNSKEKADLDIKSIVEQVQTGDIHAYTEIIRCFQKPIYIYCYYLLGNKEEAEDASQDIFIKGLENISHFSYTVSFSAWLYKIAHHHCIDLIKKKNKGFKFWTSFKKDHAYKHTHEQGFQYDDIIHELLEQLHMDERRILLLRSIEEYSFDEIASIMELKPTTVRKKYERLRKKLLKKNKLGGESYEHSFKTGG